MPSLIKTIHNSKIIGRIVHTLDYELCSELSDCESVLDIGCGPSSLIKICKNIKYSVGVEAYKPYLIKSKKLKIHNKYVSKKIEDLDFPENSFDAVIAIEVIEHLPKKEVLEFLKKADRWAKKKIIITSPNGFFPQSEIDGNILQKHLSGWDLRTMQKLGFECRGLAGLKKLRDNEERAQMGDDLTESIKYKPKLFWFAIATMSQIVTYHLPELAFELFSVKKKC